MAKFLDSDAARGLRALRHRSYRDLVVGFSANQLGFWLSHLSLQGLVVDLSDNDPSKVTLLFLFMFLPAAVIAPVAGVAADRVDRRRLAQATYAAVVVLAAALAVLTETDNISLGSAYAFALGFGMCFAVLGPTMSAVVANTVPTRDLASAISIQSVVANVSRVVGPLLAAPLIAAELFGWGFGSFAVGSAMAVILLSRVQLTPYESDTDRAGVLRRIRDGFDHARERRPTLGAISAMAAMSIFGVSTVGLIPTFTEEALGQDRGRFTLVVAATGVGAIFGALGGGYDARRPSLARASLYLVAYGTFALGFALNSSFPLALAIQAVMGVFYFLGVTQLQTLVQVLVDDAKRGRVMSLFQVAWGGVLPIGSLLLSLAVGPVGWSSRLTYAVTSVALITITGAIALRASIKDRPVGLPRHGR